MQQTPPETVTPEFPELGPSRLRRRRRQPNLWVRRLVFVGALCAVTALVGTGVGWAAKGLLPPTVLGLAPTLPNQLNVLVVGIDPTPLPLKVGDKATRQVADSLHVISVDTKRDRGFVLSIPRQTFVILGEAGPGPISDALALGDVEMLRESVETVTGLTIHHHVAFEMDGLKRLFKEVGESEVYVSGPLKGEDAAAKLSLDLGEGFRTLMPEQALAYGWLRPENDELTRLERQHLLMHQWQERFQGGWSWTWAPGAISRSQALGATDMPKRDYDAVVGEIAKIDPERMSYAILPGSVSADGHWVPSQKRVDALLSRLLVAPENKSPRALKPTIEILYNDAGDEKVMDLAGKLTEQGFQVLRTARYNVAQRETRLIDRAKLEERSEPVVEAIDKAVGDMRVVMATDEINAYGVSYSLELGKDFFRK